MKLFILAIFVAVFLGLGWIVVDGLVVNPS